MTTSTPPPTADITDAQRTAAAKALSHPLRAKLLELFGERITSPTELASELDEPLTNVSYHVRQLAELGMIQLVDSQPRRGALEHYYTAAFSADVIVVRLDPASAERDE